MSARRLHRLTVAAASVAALTAAGLTSGSATAAPAPSGPPDGKGKGRMVPVQILSFNDLHGNLEPPAGSGGRVTTDYTADASGNPAPTNVDAGGVEYLSTHLRKAREGQRVSFTVSSGDLVGGSPLLSAAFHDEPTIEAMNLLGLQASAVGNHEFDEGYRELQRLARGGCLPDGGGKDNQNSCPDGSFAGADFDYLAANVKENGTNRPILAPYTVKRVGPVKVGFIGVVLKETPSIVTAAGVKGLTFTDEVAEINAAAKELRRKHGVKAIVALVHQGGMPAQQGWQAPRGATRKVAPTYDYTCAKGGSLTPESPILDIARRADSQVDLVVTGHTHQSYICDVKDPSGNPRLVTSALAFGRLFSDTRAIYDKSRQDFVRSSITASNRIVTRDVAPDPAMTRLIDRYEQHVKPIAARVLGTITADVTRAAGENGESPLGRLIADAQLADPSTVTGGRVPQIAFMNPGGIRADLTRDAAAHGEAAGQVTYEEAFTVQPFNNYLVSMDLTGEQIYRLLAEQVTGANAASPRILAVSKGFTYQLTSTGAAPGSVRLNGEPVELSRTYRVVVNSFLSDGGDNFPTLAAGTGRYFGGLDIDAFAAYLQANSPYAPGGEPRITR